MTQQYENFEKIITDIKNDVRGQIEAIAVCDGELVDWNDSFYQNKFDVLVKHEIRKLCSEYGVHI